LRGKSAWIHESEVRLSVDVSAKKGQKGLYSQFRRKEGGEFLIRGARCKHSSRLVIAAKTDLLAHGERRGLTFQGKRSSM